MGMPPLEYKKMKKGGLPIILIQYLLHPGRCGIGIANLATEFQQLAEAAKRTGAYISLGFSERDAVIGTLYNSNVIFEPDGSYKIHRKLKPTGSERLVWGDANKDYFPITETPWGPIGSLICWESYMPLARVALYQKGITIYISPNTNDNPEWQATIQHIAIEGKCLSLIHI